MKWMGIMEKFAWRTTELSTLRIIHSDRNTTDNHRKCKCTILSWIENNELIDAI